MSYINSSDIKITQHLTICQEKNVQLFNIYFLLSMKSSIFSYIYWPFVFLMKITYSHPFSMYLLH